MTHSQRARTLGNLLRDGLFVFIIVWPMVGSTVSLTPDLSITPLYMAAAAALLSGILYLVFLQLVQTLAQSDVKWLLASIEQTDPGRAPIFLFLRSFAAGRSTVAMRIGAAIMSRVSGSILWRRHDPEEELANAIGTSGHLLAIGDKFASYGAGKVHVSDAEWQTTFADLANAAHAIFIMPGPTEAVIWEIGQIAGNAELLAKSIVVMPREGTHDWSGGGQDMRQWYETTGRIARATGIEFPAYSANGAYLRINRDRSTDAISLDVFARSLAVHLKQSRRNAGEFDIRRIWPQNTGR